MRKSFIILLTILLCVVTLVCAQQQCSVNVNRTGGLPPMGPLVKSAINSRYFVIKGTSQAVVLTGSHTWDDFLDTDQSASPAAFPFANFVNMLKVDGHNATILWYKDLPRICNWNSATWNLRPNPWARSATAGASDGGNKFDLTVFNQAYFDRLRSEVLTLQQNRIYAIVQLFDGNDLTSARCGTTSPNGDGYPLTGINNINGVSDGYTSGAAGVGAFTMATNNAVTGIQDAYLKKVLDTLNDLDNVIYEVAEEQPGTSFAGTPGYGGHSTMDFWAPHMIGLVKAYELGGLFEGTTYPGKPLQHPVGIGSMNFNDRLNPQGDAVLYASNADWIAPTVTATAPDTFPSNVPINNQGKVVISDSDHALGWAAFVNSSTGVIDDVNLRRYIWENLTQGAEGVVFMDPYVVFWSTNQRNPCSLQVNGICPSPMTKYDPFRQALGRVSTYLARIANLQAMTPQPALSSTGFALVNNTATTSEFTVYFPSGGAATVNIAVQAGRLLSIEWFNPVDGTITNSGTVAGGSNVQPVTPPWGSTNDAVLHLTDAGPTTGPKFAAVTENLTTTASVTASSSAGGGLVGGGNPQIPATTLTWFSVPNTNVRTLCPSYAEIQGTVGCPSIITSWNSVIIDPKRQRMVFPFNGGDQDYFGNETISINTGVNPMTKSLLRDATHNPNLGSLPVESYLDGQPSARHTYSGPQYIDWLDVYLQYGGFKPMQGGFSNKIWETNPDTISWVLQTTTGTPPLDPSSGSEPGTIYDIGNETIQPSLFNFSNNEPALRQFNLLTNTWSGILNGSSGCSGQTNLSTVFDPGRRIMIMIGQGFACKWLTDSPYTRTILALTNCGSVKSNSAPGLDYDPVFHDIGMYVGNNTLFIYNPDTDSCTSITGAGTSPGGASPQGTYRRLYYDTNNGTHNVVNSIDGNMFMIRRDTVANLQAKDWANRSLASGVIVAHGWTQTDINNAHCSNAPGLVNCNGTMTLDPTTFTSNGASLRCLIPAQSFAHPCGEFNDDLSQTFGNGSTFYVQGRYKMSSQVQGQHPHTSVANGDSETFPKLWIFAWCSGTNPSCSPSTCGNVEITTTDYQNRHYPDMYSQCGADGFVMSDGAGGTLDEQGDNQAPPAGTARIGTGFNCNHNFSGAQRLANCATIPADTWVTFYYKIQIGTFGSPNSTIQAWIAYPGQQYRQWINVKNHTLQLEAGSSGYNFTTILAYYSFRDGTRSFGADGYVYYGDYIVSTQPIAVPMAPVN